MWNEISISSSKISSYLNINNFERYLRFLYTSDYLCEVQRDSTLKYFIRCNHAIIKKNFLFVTLHDLKYFILVYSGLHYLRVKSKKSLLPSQKHSNVDF